jgi:hypothetical protein
MPDMPISIMNVREITQATPGGQVSQLMQVTYMVGKLGPFSADFPKDGFNASAVNVRLKELASQLNLLHGV